MHMTNSTIVQGTYPTTWGLNPIQLHDRFWTSQGVQVIHRGRHTPLADDAEYFMLLDADHLILARLHDLLAGRTWPTPSLHIVRLQNQRDLDYRELLLTDSEGEFRAFRRDYIGQWAPTLHVALTRDPLEARLWQRATDNRSAWRRLYEKMTAKPVLVPGLFYDGRSSTQLSQLVRDLVEFWPAPNQTIARLRPAEPSVWIHDDAQVDPNARFFGPVWVGAGRRIGPDAAVLGPAVLWDDPDSQPQPSPLRRQSIAPPPIAFHFTPPAKPRRLFGKRVFDIIAALIALTLTLPLYPLVMAAIWLEDGRPFFFGHRRQTRGGQPFACLKFRSMRKDAERIKAQLARQNQADGPQFFIEHDPRLTRVGQFIRRFNIDELPQFINVLLGHMSIVGPRPSPHHENQYCPAWREARLSVRPGITGLWQVRRTRQPGLDFQEWIKFDIEYVRKLSWRLDLLIIWQTVMMILRRQ